MQEVECFPISDGVRREERLKRLKGLMIAMKTPPSSEDCPICLEVDSAKERVTLKCRHSFHSDCAQKWLQRKMNCPYCRQRI
jgi:hypothetical protein